MNWIIEERSFLLQNDPPLGANSFLSDLTSFEQGSKNFNGRFAFQKLYSFNLKNMACKGLKKLLANAKWPDGRYVNQPAHLGILMTSLGIIVMSYCYDNRYMMAFV